MSEPEIGADFLAISLAAPVLGSVSGDHRDLGQKCQRATAQPSQPALSHRSKDKLGIERHWLAARQVRVPSVKNPMQVTGTATVVPVLPPEFLQRQRVEVIDHRIGGKDKRSALFAPSNAEFAIFGGGQGKALIEAAQFKKPIACASDVVRSEKGRVSALGSEPVIKEIAKLLAGRGIGVARQSVFDPATNQTFGISLMRLHQLRNPIRSRSAVVIGESQEGRGRLLGTAIACGGGPGVLLPDTAYVWDIGADGAKRLGAAVVDDNDLNLWDGLLDQGVKARSQRVRAAITRDNDRGDGGHLAGLSKRRTFA